jgi:bifunctional non-homologous end joining protein LigD
MDQPAGRGTGGDEPDGRRGLEDERPMFVVREHRDAPRHFQVLLEIGGMMRVWAVPALPSAETPRRRLAREVDPVPLESPNRPQKGTKVWDTGLFRSLRSGADGQPLPLERQIEDGYVEIRLEGSRVRGRYALMRTGTSVDDRGWLLVKLDDAGS